MLMINKLLIMNNLAIDESGNDVDTSAIYGREFLDEVNKESIEIKGRSDYINEIFLYFFIPLFEKIKFIEKANVEKVEFDKWIYSEAVVWAEAARRNGIVFSNIKKLGLYFRACSVFLAALFSMITFSLILPFYTLFRFRSNKFHLQGTKDFAVIRSPASLSKMSFLKPQGVVFFGDELCFKSDEICVYSASLASKLQTFVFVPIFSVLDFFAVFKDSIKILGFWMACDVTKYYVKRIPHKINFQFYIEKLFKNYNFATYYTGNKEDRFALLEKRLCARYDLKCICVPHGLEYSYRMPAGLVGDVFYCNSLYAKKYLDKMYIETTTNFIFDKSVVEKMLTKNRIDLKERKIVFFPESRESEKNLDILKTLISLKLEFYVKLHTKDCIENYLPYVSQDMLLENFDEAISGNICLARKSTVLLEAIYNNSIPIAVLIDSKDKKYVELMFPSLNDEAIFKIYSTDDLQKILLRLEVKHVH